MTIFKYIILTVLPPTTKARIPWKFMSGHFEYRAPRARNSVVLVRFGCYQWY